MRRGTTPGANTQVDLLDPQRRRVPMGAPGELYIGGAGLARGYLHRPALTAEAFVPDPCSATPEARLYRTGDLARYGADGVLEFLGRRDQQVKLRGFRIELGEIEAVLARHADVRQAVVAAQEVRPGDQGLVAYVIPQQQPGPTAEELRRFVQQTLPDYMVPTDVLMLHALPLTPNGKVDRRALPVPDTARPELKQAFVAPRTSVEAVLAGIWSELLGVDRIGVHDHFFDLGGHSLLATQIIARLHDIFGVPLSVRRLLENPTIADLAQTVADVGGEPWVEDIAQLVQEVHQLSLDEVKQMLLEPPIGGEG